METYRGGRLGQGLETDRSRALTDRGSQAFASLRFSRTAHGNATERDAASSGAGSAGGCTVQGPQLVPRCASRVLRRRPREGSALATGQTGNSARRRGQRGASWRRPKLAREGEGSTAGFLAAATACACAACLAASTTSEKLAAGGCDFRCVACILKAPTTRRERVGVGDRTPRRRAQRGCTLLH